MGFQLVFIQHTSKPTPGLDGMIAVIDCFVGRDLRRNWGVPEVTMRIASEPEDRGENEIAVNLRDLIPEAAKALAYHQVTNGVPDIEVGTTL